jgi:hypothetical protein
MKYRRRTISMGNFKTVCATVFGAIAAVALVAGCGNDGDTGDEDARFDSVLEQQNLDVDQDAARQAARNACSDLDASTDDPANVDPFEVYRIAQKTSIKTGLSTEDAAKLVGAGIEVYCPEYKAGWGK